MRFSDVAILVLIMSQGFADFVAAELALAEAKSDVRFSIEDEYAVDWALPEFGQRQVLASIASSSAASSTSPSASQAVGVLVRPCSFAGRPQVDACRPLPAGRDGFGLGLGLRGCAEGVFGEPARVHGRHHIPRSHLYDHMEELSVVPLTLDKQQQPQLSQSVAADWHPGESDDIAGWDSPLLPLSVLRPWHYFVEDLLTRDELSSLPRGGIRAAFAALPLARQSHYIGRALTGIAGKVGCLSADPLQLLADVGGCRLVPGVRRLATWTAPPV